MWQAIAYVSSGLTLAAFVAAVIARILKSKLEERERLIRAADGADRADLVRNALEFFNVEAADLTKEQQFKIALEQIEARGRRFAISAAVICFLAVVAALATAFAIALNPARDQQATASRADKLAGVDPALVGSWNGVGGIENFEIQLHFDFAADGGLSRRYVIDERGAIETTPETLTINAGRAVMTGQWKYALNGPDLLKLSSPTDPTTFQLLLQSAHGASTEFTRVGASEYPNDALVGAWRTSLLLSGVDWDWSIEIGRERNFHSHLEARDERGRIAAAVGKWEMTSDWSTAPIEGTYRIVSPGAAQFNIWPFGLIALKRAP